MANLRIKLVKSLSGRLKKHIATAESLGLRRIGAETVQPDNARFCRGMGAIVVHRKTSSLNGGTREHIH